MDGYKFTRSFVSEAELEEQRAQCSKAWEKAHAGNAEPQQEQVYDPRTLYERLQENKRLKQEQYEEAKRPSNLIPKLKDDELDFLKKLDEQEDTEEGEKMRQEREALARFRREVREVGQSAIALPTLTPTADDVPKTFIESPVLANSITKPTVKRSRPIDLLQGAVRLAKRLSLSESDASASASPTPTEVSATVPPQLAHGSKAGTPLKPSANEIGPTGTSPSTAADHDLHALLGGYCDSDSESDETGSSGPV
ncbi:hypothetical protein IWQ60_012102 [Tieghemiomyces parasiticus]|uniref:FAM192A/Fyv6 N-terminal domain-containing protein n=1 Tax=Tieghemiomyces parasiticus TaxID=78921 RepID=A0A9W7ZHG2_9FUNG|nr:hypothetical protein IWQ60_012102 [Tieghemiomyces parasiticus]